MNEIFENVRLYDTPSSRKTGTLVLRYICDGCNQEIESSRNFQIPTDDNGNELVHKTKFWCEECWRKRVTK